MCRAATLATAVLGFVSLSGMSARFIRSTFELWRLRRRLFEHRESRLWGVFSFSPFTVVINLQPSRAYWARHFHQRWTVHALVQGTLACTWHHLRPCSCTRRTWVIDALGGMCFLAWTLFPRTRQWMIVVVMAISGRIWMLLYSLRSPIGAVCMTVEGVACFLIEARRMYVEERVFVERERLERARIGSQAFAVHAGVYLHQEYHMSDAPRILMMSIISRERRYTACVRFDDEKHVVVDCGVDRMTLNGHAPMVLCRPPPHADVMAGLMLIRSALSATNAMDNELARELSWAAGVALAGEYDTVERRARAQRTIRRKWTECVTDPAHPACARRLVHEFTCLTVIESPAVVKG